MAAPTRRNVDRADVVVVGGGFSGAVLALHLLRAAQTSIRVAIVEPRAALGRGLAYGTTDPDHRLNGPIDVHMVYPERPQHLREWYLQGGGLALDPEAEAADGGLYIRRSVFGDYVGEQLQAAAADNPAGSVLDHRHQRAINVTTIKDGYRVSLEDGSAVDARAVAVAASYGRPAIPRPFHGAPEKHPAFVGDPWDTAASSRISADARVLILGVAQTGSEVVAGLIRRGHRGRIIALSRQGLRPVPRPVPQPAGAAPPDSSLHDRVNRPVSLFVERHGPLATVAGILRALREDIALALQDGGTWAEPFGLLRDSLWQVWPDLPVTEKRRYLRHLRRWYDAHRFQLPPQVEERLATAEASEQVAFMAGAVRAATAQNDALVLDIRQRGAPKTTTETVDAVINCTGPAARPDQSGNPFLASLMDTGLAAPHPAGPGFAVDGANRAIGSDGAPARGLYVVGPLTYGAFADQQSASFTALRICKIVPVILEGLTE